MTREEAIRLLKQYQGYESMSPDGEKLKHAFDLTDETVDTLLSALRPISREQVEKVFPGCQMCEGWNTIKFGLVVYNRRLASGYVNFQFCPFCGKPKTDEAVEMVIERLEVLKDGVD